MLLISSLWTYGQKGTGHLIERKDTVAIPAVWFKMASEDLERYDDCKKERSMLIDYNEKLQKELNQWIFTNTLNEDRVKELELNVDEIKKAGLLVEKKRMEEVEILQRQFKVERKRSSLNGVKKLVIGTGIGGFIGVLITIFIIK